ncbi:MAG: PAS domain S-box protein [Methanospirillaceae archaeon]|nr:PAS domain S-box protein [Methanospirillaceae archaeon]
MDLTIILSCIRITAGQKNQQVKHTVPTLPAGTKPATGLPGFFGTLRFETDCIKGMRRMLEKRKVVFSIILGLAGFIGAFFSFQFDIAPLTISLIWSYCFPLAAALAYGRNYGCIAGLFGLAAFFPIFLWPSNGWGYGITVALLLLWFIWHGYCRDIRNDKKRLWYHPLIAQVPYALFYGLITYLVYPFALSCNPPFWQDTAVTSISSELLVSMIIMATIMMYLNLIIADTMLLVPVIRKILGLPVRNESRNNGVIILLSIGIAIVIWAAIVAYTQTLVMMKFPQAGIDLSDPYYLLSFIILVPSGCLVGGILARYFESRYEIEDQLRKSEEKFRSLYNHMTEGVALHAFVYDTAKGGINYRILDINPSFEAIFNLKRSDVINRIATDVFTRDLQPYHEMVLLMAEKHIPTSFEASIPDVGKTLLISVSPLGKEGFATICTDITERKRFETALIQSEEKCRILVEHAPEAILVIEIDTKRFIDANIQAERLFACSREEILQSAPEEFYPHYEEDDPAYLLCKEKMSLCSRQALSGEEIVTEQTFRNKAGEEILCEVRLVRLPGPGNRVRISLTDISERIRIAEGFAQATKKLNLLSTITCNDIQNSIYGLYAYIELQQDHGLDDLHSSLIQKEINLINKTLKILNFARNYQDLGLKPPLWQNVTHVFLYAISHMDVSRLSRKVHLDNLYLFADPLLEKILASLVENVLVHAPSATGIQLTYRICPDKTMQVLFADDGPGIPDDLKESIFERNLEIKGGMSLFLTREMLSITGISIVEKGIYKEGTRFIMTVPRGGYRFSEDADL